MASALTTGTPTHLEPKTLSSPLPDPGPSDSARIRRMTARVPVPPNRLASETLFLSRARFGAGDSPDRT
jgi:hypothetical protein